MLFFAHLLLAAFGILATALARAAPISYALTATWLVDVAFVFARGWPQTTLAAFVGPVAVIVAVARTFALARFSSAALALPIVALAIAAWLGGPRLGAHGIAWLLLAANAYAARVGLKVVRQGNAETPRAHVTLAALLVTSSAPQIAGWAFRAFGASMRPAVALDCVCLAAIVVGSLAAWSKRSFATFSPRLWAPFSGRRFSVRAVVRRLRNGWRILRRALTPPRTG